MSEWRDISTAPKDGTTIIGWCVYMLEPATVRWSTRRRGGLWEAVWEQGSVIEHESDFGTEYKEADEPTHWQPLPAPPEPSGTDMPPVTTQMGVK